MNAVLRTDRTSTRRAFALGAVAVASALCAGMPALASSDAKVVPPYAGSAPAPTSATETAVLAGGCFWGVQGVYQHVRGVTSAVSGYAGGDMKSASYLIVSSGATAHAEAVKVTYDPRQISYAQILQVFFSVAHDPTQLNRQGPDHGTQYRSAIFPTTPEQAQVAQAYIAQLDKAHVWSQPIVTKIETGKAFFPAEDYHQDFLVRNPTYPYIVWNDLPKIEDLKRIFPAAYRPDPVLVAQAKKAG